MADLQRATAGKQVLAADDRRVGIVVLREMPGRCCCCVLALLVHAGPLRWRPDAWDYDAIENDLQIERARSSVIAETQRTPAGEAPSVVAPRPLGAVRAPAVTYL